MTINIEQISFEHGDFARVLRWADDIDAVEIVSGDGRIVPLKGSGSLWHLHDEIELTLVTSGRGTRIVGDQIAQFVAPSLVLLGANLPHYWEFVGKSTGLSVQLGISRLQNWLPTSAANELPRLARRAAKGLVFKGRTSDRLTNVLQDLHAACGLRRTGILLQLIGDLASTRRSSSEQLSSKRFDVSCLAPGYEAIQRAILLVMSRLSDELSLEDALAVSCMSKANFSRRFLFYTGKTFTEFLNDVRIDYACRRLVGTSDCIGDVAQMSGYQNLSHFNRMFRRLRGCSPTEYRSACAE